MDKLRVLPYYEELGFEDEGSVPDSHKISKDVDFDSIFDNVSGIGKKVEDPNIEERRRRGTLILFGLGVATLFSLRKT